MFKPTLEKRGLGGYAFPLLNPSQKFDQKYIITVNSTFNVLDVIDFNGASHKIYLGEFNGKSRPGNSIWGRPAKSP